MNKTIKIKVPNGTVKNKPLTQVIKKKKYIYIYINIYLLNKELA